MRFSEAMKRRFACRNYQEKEIPADDLKQILEWGRLSASSFSLEPWLFQVERGRKQQLYEACCNQEMVRHAGVSIIIFARNAVWFDPDGEYVRQRFSRIPLPLERAVEDFRPFHSTLEKEGAVDRWSMAQCYIAAANMTTGAKTLGIDSCILEGFEEQKILDLYQKDPALWRVALVIPFGYSAVAEAAKIRESFDSVVEGF